MYLIGFGGASTSIKEILKKTLFNVERVDILDSIQDLDNVGNDGTVYDRIIIYSTLLKGLAVKDYCNLISTLCTDKFRGTRIVFFCTDKEIASALNDEIVLYQDRMAVLFQDNLKITSSLLLKLVKDDLRVLTAEYGLIEEVNVVEENSSYEMETTDNTQVFGVLKGVDEVDVGLSTLAQDNKEPSLEVNTLKSQQDGLLQENTTDKEPSSLNDCIVEEQNWEEDWGDDFSNGLEEPTEELIEEPIEEPSVEELIEEPIEEPSVDEFIGTSWGEAIEEVTEEPILEVNNVETVLADGWGEVEEPSVEPETNGLSDLEVIPWNDNLESGINKVEPIRNVELESVPWGDTTNTEKPREIPKEPISETPKEQPKRSLFGRNKASNLNSSTRKVAPSTQVKPSKKGNRLSTLLESYGKRGCSMVFIGDNSGNTTVVDNLATLITDLGYSSLVVDLNIYNRGLASITKENYQAVHGVYTDSASLREGLNSSTEHLGSIACISKPDYHLLTLGLASQYISHKELTNSSKLSKFATTSKNEYNFILYDISLNDVSYYNSIVSTADIIVTTCGLNNKSLYSYLLKMCNIEDDDVMDILFSRAKILFTFDNNPSKLLGEKCSLNIVTDILDKELRLLLGEEPDYMFNNLTTVGSIKYNKDYSSLWGIQSAVELKEYRNEYIEILENILK